MDGSARHRRLPSQCEQGGRSPCRARRQEEAGELRAERPARSVSSPSAGSHCLNGLPVHRSIVVAGRRGRANGGEPAVRSGYKTEWPTVMAASRSRRGGRHLIPSRVLIKGHTGTLRAKAGYCPDVATPACRSRVRAAFRPARPVPARRQAARPTPLRGMPPPAPATASPEYAGVCASRGGRAVVQRSVHDLASLQYQRMSAHAWPPSGTSKARGSAMPHMAHSAASSGRSSRRAVTGGSATVG